MSTDRHRTYHFLGNIIRFHAFPAETGGRCAIVEIRVAPGAGAPPNHHAGEDESFFVVEGMFEFMIDGATRTAGPGDFVKIPDGAVHAFTCIDDAPGRLLCVNAPGAVHDAFFTGVGDPAPEGSIEFPEPDGPPDLAAIMAIAEKAGVHIVAPDGAPG